MTATVVDFTVANNETWDTHFTLVDAEGEPVNLTGRSLKIQLRNATEFTNVVIELSTDNGRLVVIDPAGGVWALAVPAETAKDVPTGQYAYDVIDYLANDPRVWRRQKGTINVEQGVTLR